jgi:chromosome segregation ATPase
MKKHSLFTIILASFIALAASCTQSEVAYEKLIDKLNGAIGEYDIKLKDYEKAISAMQLKYEEAIYAKHQGKANAAKWQSKLDKEKRELDELKSKEANIVLLVEKGAPYLVDSGKEYTMPELASLLSKLKSKIGLQHARIESYSSLMENWLNLSESSEDLQERLKTNIVEAKSRLSILIEKIDMLSITKGQVGSAKTITEEMALNGDSVLNDIASTDMSFSAKLDANNEMLDDLLSMNSGMTSLDATLSDF